MDGKMDVRRKYGQSVHPYVNKIADLATATVNCQLSTKMAAANSGFPDFQIPSRYGVLP